MTNTKASLRAAMQARLLAQSQEERRMRSSVIQKKLWTLPVFKKANLVLFFVSMPEEVDTRGMISEALAQGKRIAVPAADLKTKKLLFFEIRDFQRDLRPGIYEILEPDPAVTKPILLTEVSCVLVPGVVFDQKNHRIGHGAGFYDRFLKSLDAKVPKVGLAYSFQVVKEVPQESHDVALDALITD